jgi:hypothetical protein
LKDGGAECSRRLDAARSKHTFGTDEIPLPEKAKPVPITLDFIKARMQAYKKTLDGRAAKKKEGQASIQIAQQFNAIVEEVKKEPLKSATHFLQRIPRNGPAERLLNVFGMHFLRVETMLNVVVAVMALFRAAYPKPTRVIGK